MSVRPFPSRAVEGQALWCPTPEHVGPRLWRIGYARMTEAVCTPCHEARRSARIAESRGERWRRVAAALLIVGLLASLVSVWVVDAYPEYHLDSAWPVPTDGEVR